MIKLKGRGRFFPTCFEELTPILRSRMPFLILDRDGTLVPNYENPRESVLAAGALRVIHRTAQALNGRVAIISARSLRSLSAEFDADSMILAGNYGMEISCPTSWQFLHPVANQSQQQIYLARLEIEKLVYSQPQLILDDHVFSLCLHFHRLPFEHHNAFHDQVEQLKSKYFTLSFRRLPTSYELLPLIQWEKAYALDKIAEAMKLGEQDLLYVAFGDSIYDEPLFVWANDKHGLSFLVGDCPDTQARGAVDNPGDVIAFLEQISDLVSVNAQAG